MKSDAGSRKQNRHYLMSGAEVRLSSVEARRSSLMADGEAADVAEERERAQIFALRSQVESGIFLVAPVAVGLVADVFSLSTSLWLASATMGSGVVGFRMLSRNTSR